MDIQSTATLDEIIQQTRLMMQKTKELPLFTVETTTENCPFRYNCFECEDAVYLNDNKRISYKVEKCRSKQQRILRLKSSGLSAKEQTETFANADVDKTNKDLFAFLQNDWSVNQWLYLYGLHGIGKSYTANCIANMLIDKGVNVLVAREVDMASNIQATFTDSSGDQERKLMHRYKNIKVLIIQDVGKYGLRKGSEWWPSILYDIIDSRLLKGLAIVFTSNYSLRELADKLGENHGLAIESRLTGLCTQVKLSGKDRRSGKT